RISQVDGAILHGERSLDVQPGGGGSGSDRGNENAVGERHVAARVRHRANVIEVAPAKRGEIEVASAQPGVGNRYAVQDGIVGVGHDVPRPIATIDVDVLPLGSS